MPKQAGQQGAKDEVKIESLLIWGPHPNEIRATFAAAQPILKELPTKVDRVFLKYLLREQTWIALGDEDSEQQKIKHAWIDLCRSLQRFLKVISEKTMPELEDDLRKKRAAAEAAGTTIHYWPPVNELKPSSDLAAALKFYSDMFSLPGYKEALERKRGGRPNVAFPDAVAFAMKEHSKAKTDSPNWSMISRLLKCAPPVPRVSMEAEKIRQRLNQLQREERKPKRVRPTVRQLAYEFTRQYRMWNKSGPCPSLVQPSLFRSPSNDTSLTEDALLAKVDELHKKYKTDKIAER